MVLLNILYDIFMISSQKNIIHKYRASENRATAAVGCHVVTSTSTRTTDVRIRVLHGANLPTYIVLYFIFSNIGSAPIIELGSQCDMDGCIDLFC